MHPVIDSAESDFRCRKWRSRLSGLDPVLVFGLFPLIVHYALESTDVVAQEFTASPQPLVESGLFESDSAVEEVADRHSVEADEAPMRIQARLYADAEIIDQAAMMTENPRFHAIDIRKLELNVRGSLQKNVQHKMQVDIAGGGIQLKDAYLEYGGWPVFLTVGQLKPMNSMTSTTTQVFMERAAIQSAFGSGRQIGVGLSYKDARWTFFAGGFRGAVTGRHTDLGRTYSSRITAVPILRKRLMIHIGGNIRHRIRERDDPLFQYRGGSLLHLGDWSVDTGHFADEDMLFGVELAGIVRSFSVESECMLLRASTLTARGYNRSFNGCYILGSWFLSGETRRYEEGRFLDVVTDSVFKRGTGAWQIAARYDVIDLSDDAVIGGEQHTWTLGVNWYMSNHLRLAANYSQAKIEGGLHDGARTNALGMRLGIIW